MPSDTYAKKDLLAQVTTSMKRRAAFAAKCAREHTKITGSATLTARVLNQWKNLNAAIGQSVSAIPTTATAWVTACAPPTYPTVTNEYLDALMTSTATTYTLSTFKSSVYDPAATVTNTYLLKLKTTA